MNEKEVEQKIRNDLQQAVKNLSDLAQTELTDDVTQDAFIKRFELLYEFARIIHQEIYS